MEKHTNNIAIDDRLSYKNQITTVYLPNARICSGPKSRTVVTEAKEFVGDSNLKPHQHRFESVDQVFLTQKYELIHFRDGRLEQSF